jgi:predicted transglutaminase-like cysteine proteinase
MVKGFYAGFRGLVAVGIAVLAATAFTLPAEAAAPDAAGSRFLLIDESADVLPTAFAPAALLAPTSPVEPSYESQGVAVATLGDEIPNTVDIWHEAFAEAPPDYGVLRSVAIRVGRLPAIGNWEHVTDRDYGWIYSGACPPDSAGICQTPFVARMHAVVAAARHEEPARALEMINGAVNHAIVYRPDIDLWHVADYWENPSEIAAKGAGDCEDYAIAKYWLLRSLGVAEDDLQLIVLIDKRNGAYHAVLGVHLAGATYILDSLTDHVAKDSLFIRYTPIMSFVADTGYIHGFKTGDTRAVANAAMPLSRVAPGL